ncbi:UNVERIFIED_CONTAM: hypothetical protein GTU68_040604 [Idotea baltica]|nr:hypothetical protein [Idotea baltica]
MKLLENKSAIITGATRGIGRGIAIEFAKQGANVAFTYSSSVDAANALEEELKALGVSAKGYQSNAANFDAAQQLAKDVLKEFGSIDILVNNAGITKVEVNLKSVFNLTKAVIRPMMKQRAGSIINMSSVVGLKGNAGQTNYAASKAGIVGFSKSVALELGSRNIRSNVVAPGFIETEMTAKLDEATVQSWRDGIPLKRGGQPEDIANACVFLGSDMSAYITGQTLSVDGGMLT